VEEKGLGDLLLALAELRGRLPDLRLLVLGEGQHRAVFERACRDLGLTDRVSFLGWVAAERVADHLRAADLFVGPSRTGVNGWVEAQGLTFLEAMQAGVPVVATRSGGIPDVVVHEQTGLLVPERAPAELAAAIERLHRDRGLASRLAKTAGERVREGFTRAGSAAAFSRLFQDLLDPCRAQAAPAGAA
jgi:glycosyltransferase involved in cell wall biosynthesis